MHHIAFIYQLVYAQEQDNYSYDSLCYQDSLLLLFFKISDRIYSNQFQKILAIDIISLDICNLD